MKVASGTVVSGKIIVEGHPFKEGATVTVLGSEDGETFTLNADDEAALLLAIEEADRGDVIDGSQLLRDLGPRE